jgi:WW domain
MTMSDEKKQEDNPDYVPPPAVDLDLRLGVAAVLKKLQLTFSDCDSVLLRNCDSHTGYMAKNFDTLEGLQELLAVFEAIALLPKLTHFQLHLARGSSSPDKPHKLPSQLLSMILHQCLDLVYVRFQGIMLSDANGKYDGLANALRMHPSLVRLHLVVCAPDQGLTLDPLLAALPGIPTLREVELVDSTITSPACKATWTGDTLLHLALSKNLWKIRISCIRHLLDTHIQAMALAHEKSDTLRVLVIEGEEDDEDDSNGNNNADDDDDLYKDDDDDEETSKKKKEKKEKKKKKKKELVNKKKSTMEAKPSKDDKKEKKKKKKKESKSDWSSAVAPNGNTYYYNKKTGATTWEKPADF